jgi:hypothetical protein
MLLELRKKGEKHWLLIDAEIGEFTPSKFTINRLNNVINIVYFNNLKSKEYNVSDCYIFDIDDTIGFNTSNGVSFMDKLEELNCPCFQKDVNNFYISGGGGTWGSITGDIEEQTDLMAKFNEKQDNLNAINLGQIIFHELSIKATPSANDKIVMYDSITEEAFTTEYSDFKDVLEFANLVSFPVTGKTSKIYIDLDTNLQYRWSGSSYVKIGGASEEVQQLQRYWYSLTVNTLNTTLMQVNNTNVFTVAGTATVVSRLSNTYYNSIAMNNYLSTSANGSNCGIKNNNQGDGSYLEGFDSSFCFINNDINVNCETTVGYYSALSAIPNISKSNYTADFVGIGNDVGDVNLSFYCKRYTETPSYTKVDCGANFPAHTTTDAYILRMQMTRGFNNSGRTLKMTITNIITGAVFLHTFTDTQIPASSRAITMVVNRSSRNSGVATNIRFSKWHQTKYIY